MMTSLKQQEDHTNRQQLPSDSSKSCLNVFQSIRNFLPVNMVKFCYGKDFRLIAEIFAGSISTSGMSFAFQHDYPSVARPQLPVFSEGRIV